MKMLLPIRSLVFIALSLSLGGTITRGFYNPTQGRWLNRDPIEERDGPALYAFVRNDALNKWDRLGQSASSSPNGCFGSSPASCPANNIDPPPQGPFSSCRVALACGSAQALPGVPLPMDHCGLIIDVGTGVYALDGTGGSVNTRCLTPATANDATQAFTTLDPSVCACLLSNIKPWNDRQVPRNNRCANSNWNIKCAINNCNVQLHWGTQDKPFGYDCMECVRWRWSAPTRPNYCNPQGDQCCLEWREKPCPD